MENIYVTHWQVDCELREQDFHRTLESAVAAARQSIINLKADDVGYLVPFSDWDGETFQYHARDEAFIWITVESLKD